MTLAKLEDLITNHPEHMVGTTGMLVLREPEYGYFLKEVDSRVKFFIKPAHQGFGFGVTLTWAGKTIHITRGDFNLYCPNAIKITDLI